MGVWGSITSAASSAVSTVSHTVSRAVGSAVHATTASVDRIERTVPSAVDVLGTAAKSGIDEAGKLAKRANASMASFAKQNDPFDIGEQLHQYKSNPVGKMLSSLDPLTQTKQLAAVAYDTVAGAVHDVKSIAAHPRMAADVFTLATNPVAQAGAAITGGLAVVSPSARHTLERLANGSPASPLAHIPGLEAFRIAHDPRGALHVAGSELDLGLDVASVTGIGDVAKGLELFGKGALGDVADRGLSQLERTGEATLQRAAPRALTEPPSFPKLLESLPPKPVAKNGLGAVADLHLPDVNPAAGGLNCQYCTREVDAALSGHPTRFPEVGPDYGVPKAYTAGGPENSGNLWAEHFKAEVGSPNPWRFASATDAAARGRAIDSIEQTLGHAGDRGSLFVANANGAHIFNVVNMGGKVIAIDGQVGIYGDLSNVLRANGYADFEHFGFLKSN